MFLQKTQGSELVGNENEMKIRKKENSETLIKFELSFASFFMYDLFQTTF